MTATDINTLCAEWLWTPIGATASTWYPRPTGFPQSVDALGNPIWGLRMSARDMARFGLLIQRDARWERSRLLRPQYRRAALTSSSTMNPSYGYLWWLNGQDGYRIPSSSGLQAGSLIPNAPDDLVAALGKDDQKIYVSRSTDLVVIRQGAPAGSRGAESLSDFDNELWRMIMAARPAR